MNPMQVAQNRTARLVRESKTPAYSTTTPTPAQRERILIAEAEALACREDFCHICGRATEHYGEHSDEQILAWARKPGLLQQLIGQDWR